MEEGELTQILYVQAITPDLRPGRSPRRKRKRATTNAYFYWVTREQGSFDWFRGVMREVEESDRKVCIHIGSLPKCRAWSFGRCYISLFIENSHEQFIKCSFMNAGDYWDAQLLDKCVRGRWRSINARYDATSIASCKEWCRLSLWHSGIMTSLTFGLSFFSTSCRHHSECNATTKPTLLNLFGNIVLWIAGTHTLCKAELEECVLKACSYTSRCTNWYAFHATSFLSHPQWDQWHPHSHTGILLCNCDGVWFVDAFATDSKRSMFLVCTGVFYCGPVALAKELEVLSKMYSQKSTTKFEFHKENFWGMRLMNG